VFYILDNTSITAFTGLLAARSELLLAMLESPSAEEIRGNYHDAQNAEIWARVQEMICILGTTYYDGGFEREASSFC
jgi:hypothetical protein